MVMILPLSAQNLFLWFNPYTSPTGMGLMASVLALHEMSNVLNNNPVWLKFNPFQPKAVPGFWFHY